MPKKRGAKIYAEIVGYGSTSDAFHMTAPDNAADGLTKAIELTLEDAKVSPTDVGYINAHGTSTLLNDKIETLGIKRAFKEHAYDLNVSSTKGATGPYVRCNRCSRKYLLYQSTTNRFNSTNNQLQCDLNYTVNKAVKRDINYAMNINVGFGGPKCIVLYKKYGE